ncbi:shikimate kinase [Odoribacter laneus]|uniref:shikimate kinase n=1 Tax=Odoribacter laneus TaxID=626933 RepID=UPI003AB3249E
MKIFLVGYMACGKSRKGRVMAKEQGRRFIDLDAYIIDREKCSIAEIFTRVGEQGFRKLETRYLQEVCELYEDFILSTGGGTPCFNGNMEYMNRQGHTIFLNTDISILTARLIRGKQKRPLVSGLKDEEIHDFVRKHLEQRLPYYKMAKEEVKNNLFEGQSGGEF